MVHLDTHYVDPRLVALYDQANPRAADTDFYLHLAATLDARTIVDLGCGTGVLTRELATAGRRVIGVDPAPAMLAYAQAQPGADQVHWIHGDSQAIGTPEADLVLMTGNVAQVFLDDGQWVATLGDIAAALRPGGRLAFESRNPDDRGWQRWNRDATFTRRSTPFGPLEEWLTVTEVTTGRVTFEATNHFLATGETLVVPSTLRFRTRDELCAALTAAGMHALHVYGDWQHGPLTPASRVMVFIAERPA